MTKNKILAAVLCALSVATPAFSESETKIAVVDIQKIITDSVVGKAARNNVDNEAKKSQAKLEPLKVDYERGQADLQKQAALLSRSALEERKDQLDKKRVDFERAVQDVREQFTKKNEEQIGRVVKEIESVVQELAAERNYTFVLERDGQSVVYAGDKIDISQEIIKILDKKHVAF